VTLARGPSRFNNSSQCGEMEHCGPDLRAVTDDNTCSLQLCSSASTYEGTVHRPTLLHENAAYGRPRDYREITWESLAQQLRL